MILKIRQDVSIGGNLKQLRIKYGVSQEKLCIMMQLHGCDISRRSYAKYEGGQLNIRVSVLLTLKEIYQCDYQDFFKGIKCG